MRNRLGRGTPGNSITQRLAGGIHFQDAALIFGGIVAVEVAILQSHVLEMHIVKDSPLDACCEKQAWEPRLPHSFRDPHADRRCAKIALYAFREAMNLSDFIVVTHERLRECSFLSDGRSCGLL